MSGLFFIFDIMQNKPPRFEYVPQNPETLEGPWLRHHRKPAGILKMIIQGKFDFRTGHPWEFQGEAEPSQKEMVEKAAGKWFDSMLMQRKVPTTKLKLLT